jgi:hypothetical protein
MKYTVWVKDGMEWVKGLARDPLLADYWKWHAVYKVKVVNGEEEWYMDEPLSAKEAFEYEVSLILLLLQWLLTTL